MKTLLQIIFVIILFTTVLCYDLTNQNSDYLNPINDNDNNDNDSAKDHDKRTIFGKQIPDYGWAKHVMYDPAGRKVVLGYGKLDLKYVPIARPLIYKFGPHFKHYRRPLRTNLILRPTVPLKPIIHNQGWKPVLPIHVPAPPGTLNRPWQEEGWIKDEPKPAIVHEVHVKPVIAHPEPVVPVIPAHPKPIVPVLPSPPVLKPFPPPLFEVAKPNLGVLPLGATFPIQVLKQIPAPNLAPHLPIDPVLNHHDTTHNLVHVSPILQHFHPHHGHHDGNLHQQFPSILEHHNVGHNHHEGIFHQQLPPVVDHHDFSHNHNEHHLQFPHNDGIIHHQYPDMVENHDFIFSQQQHLPHNEHHLFNPHAHNHVGIQPQLSEGFSHLHHQQAQLDHHLDQQDDHNIEDHGHQHSNQIFVQHLPEGHRNLYNQLNIDHLQQLQNLHSGSSIQPGGTDLQLPLHLPQHSNYLPPTVREDNFQNIHHHQQQQQQQQQYQQHPEHVVRPSISLEAPYHK